jgi:hypothetical protein
VCPFKSKTTLHEGNKLTEAPSILVVFADFLQVINLKYRRHVRKDDMEKDPPKGTYIQKMF